eukprot:3365099-Rhodomonas_salina.3
MLLPGCPTALEGAAGARRGEQPQRAASQRQAGSDSTAYTANSNTRNRIPASPGITLDLGVESARHDDDACPSRQVDGTESAAVAVGRALFAPDLANKHSLIQA